MLFSLGSARDVINVMAAAMSGLSCNPIFGAEYSLLDRPSASMLIGGRPEVHL